MTGTFVHRARLALAMLAVAAAFGVAAGTARASITFVASATGATATTGATSFTIAAPTGITAGEVEIATISVAGSATVTAPSGWTQIINTPVGTSLRQVSFSHVAGSSEGTTTWTLSASSVAAGGIAAYSNVDTTTIVDASSSQTGTSGTTATVPSVTTNYNGDLVLGVGSFNNIGTLTASGSTTSRYSKSVTGLNGPTMLAEDTRLVTAGATSSQTITDNTTATAWVGQVITLKPATVAIAFVAAPSGATSSSGATSFTIAAPTGVAAGEVEIATISRQGTATVTPPSGWTQIIDTTVGTSLRQTSYWHIAGTSEGTTTWTLSASSVAAGGIAAYNNVDTTTIIDATAAQSGTSGTTATVPSVTTNYTGDVVLGVGSFNNQGTLTASGSTTSRYSVKVATTNGPDLLGEDATQATAGATTAQTISDGTSATAWIGQVIALKEAGVTGVLSVSTNAAPSFNADLNSGDQSQTYTVPLTTTASVAPAPGWNETITSTQFTTGTQTLPATASTVTATPTAVCVSAQANCSAPTNSVSYPVSVPAGSGPPTALRFFNAASRTGAGTFTVTPTVSVLVPQNSFAGTYTSTVTIAIVSGP